MEPLNVSLLEGRKTRNCARSHVGRGAETLLDTEAWFQIDGG
jgi:hypothetical protein